MGILSISSGSLIVDYRIEIPADAATEDNKAAATSLIKDSMEVELPLTTGGTASLENPVVERFVTYSYVKTVGTCPSTCSNECGAPAIAVDDIYTCVEDGVAVAQSACSPKLGDVPVTRTTCCSAADPETCIARVVPVLSQSVGGDEELVLEDDGDALRSTPDKTSSAMATLTSAGVVVAMLSI